MCVEAGKISLEEILKMIRVHSSFFTEFRFFNNTKLHN
jgi:hypothetical protein